MISNSVPIYDTAAKRRLITGEVQDVWRYRNLVYQLTKRNIAARYKRSVLGVAWTLMDPILTTAVMAIVFGALLVRNVPDFPLFLMCGIIVWTFFSQASRSAMTDLMYGGGSLMGRVYLPKTVFAVAAVGTSLVNLLFSLVPLIGLILIFGRAITWALLFIPVAVAVLMVFTLGVGLLASSISVFFADMVNIYSFLLRLMMYLSGIFYVVEFLPERLQWVVRFMPTYSMIRLFRDPIYAGTVPQLEIVGYSLFWAVLVFVLGIWLFTKRSNEIIYRV